MKNSLDYLEDVKERLRKYNKKDNKHHIYSKPLLSLSCLSGGRKVSQSSPHLSLPEPQDMQRKRMLWSPGKDPYSPGSLTGCL